MEQHSAASAAEMERVIEVQDSDPESNAGKKSKTQHGCVGRVTCLTTLEELSPFVSSLNEKPTRGNLQAHPSRWLTASTDLARLA
jgi:hypothetical protein